MKTVYMHDAEEAENRLQRLLEIQNNKIALEVAQKTAFLDGYRTAIHDAICALIHWEKTDERS